MSKMFRQFVCLLGALAGCVMAALWADAAGSNSVSEVMGVGLACAFFIAAACLLLSIGFALGEQE